MIRARSARARWSAPTLPSGRADALPHVWAILACLALAVPAQAQTQPPTTASGTPVPAITLPPRVGVLPGAATPLTLDQAIQMALEHNNDVEVARLRLDIAAEDVKAAQGLWDPRLLPTFSYQSTTTPVTSSLSGGANGTVEETRTGGTMRFEGLSPWAGGRFTVDFSASKVESSNQFLRLNPTFPTAAVVSYTQPLLRGLRMDASRRQLQLSRRAADLTDLQLTQTVMDQLSAVEQAYWDLVYATRNLEVVTTALAQARAQVASNERQVTSGTLAPIDVVEAQTQVATFEQALATAQQALTESENRLKRLVLANRDATLWNAAIAPGDQDRPVPGLPLDQAVTMALENRPELKEVDVALAQNAIDERYYGDQARPQADLVGTYTLAGLAGTTTSNSSPLRSSTDPAVLARLDALSALAGYDPVVITPSTTAPLPDFLSGGIGDSLANIGARRFPVAFVQLQIGLPIRNRTALAQVARTRINRRALVATRQQAEQSIQADVRNALQAVQSAEQRLQAAGSARRSASEQYESERRRFESGLSTVFLVLQRQTTLVTAQAREVRARADLNQAIAVFDRAVGATLTKHGVSLSPSHDGGAKTDARD
jgi:HAE1 family hydrophobic/amphiphilic exporter-1